MRLYEIFCNNCHEALDKFESMCPHCGHNTGLSSNVCRAQDDEENLIARYQEAFKRVEESNQRNLLEHFQERVETHKTVCINMRFSALRNMLMRGNYINLHDLIKSTAAEGYDTEKYSKRLISDLFIFGTDYLDIVFGALNVGNCGLVSYGEYCVVLKTEDIKNRTSFLENNSFKYVDFTQSTLSINIPEGSRALWCTVPKLCVAKHIKRILAKNHPLTEPQIADIVLYSTGDKQTDDFTEAQVLKPINIDNICKVYHCNESSTAISKVVDTTAPKSPRNHNDFPEVNKVSELEREIIVELLKERNIPFEQRKTRPDKQGE